VYGISSVAIRNPEHWRHDYAGRGELLSISRSITGVNPESSSCAEMFLLHRLPFS
jgi:hypothetical protein